MFQATNIYNRFSQFGSYLYYLSIMCSVVFQVEKDGKLLHSSTVYGITISKQSIESSVLNITGLNPDQYEAYYLDSEDDLIMTVVEEDYSIAQQTLDSDSIVFHIKVKVDESRLKFKEQKQEKDFQGELSDEQKSDEAEQIEKEVYHSSKGSDHSIEKEKSKVQEQNKRQKKFISDLANQEKLVQRQNQIGIIIQEQLDMNKNQEKSENNEENDKLNKQQQKLPIKEEENIQIINDGSIKQQDSKQINRRLEQVNVNEQIYVEDGQIDKNVVPLEDYAERKDWHPVEQQKQIEKNQLNIKGVVQDKSEKVNAQVQQSYDKFNQQMKNLRSNYLIKKSKESAEQQKHVINEQALFQRFFQQIKQKLPTILKQQCFIKKVQQKSNKYYRKSSLQCYFCRSMIEKIPYYINRKHQKICAQCQDRYDKEQILTKIRSQNQLYELFTVKTVSLLRSELTSKDLQYFGSISDEKDWERRIVEITLEKLLNQNRK